MIESENVRVRMIASFKIAKCLKFFPLSHLISVLIYPNVLQVFKISLIRRSRIELKRFSK